MKSISINVRKRNTAPSHVFLLERQFIQGFITSDFASYFFHEEPVVPLFTMNVPSVTYSVPKLHLVTKDYQTIIQTLPASTSLTSCQEGNNTGADIYEVIQQTKNHPDFPFTYYFLGSQILHCNKSELISMVRFLCSRQDFFQWTIHNEKGRQQIRRFVQSMYLHLCNDQKKGTKYEDLDNGPSRMLAWVHHFPYYYFSHVSLEKAAKGKWPTFQPVVAFFHECMVEYSGMLADLYAGPLMKIFTSIYWRKGKKMGSSGGQELSYIPTSFFHKNRLFDLIWEDWQGWMEKDGRRWFDCTTEEELKKWMNPESTYTKYSIREISAMLRKLSFMTYGKKSLLEELPRDFESICSNHREQRQESQYFHAEMFLVEDTVSKMERRVIYKRCFHMDELNTRQLNELFECILHTPSKPLVSAHRVHEFIERQRAQLSSDQAALLEDMLIEPISLITGPPGSGKTSRGIQQVVKYYLENTALTSENIFCLAPTGQSFRELCRYLNQLQSSPSSSFLSDESESKSIEMQKEENDDETVELDADALELLKAEWEAKEADVLESSRSAGGNAAGGGFEDNDLCYVSKVIPFCNLVKYSMLETKNLPSESDIKRSRRTQNVIRNIRPRLYEMFGFGTPPEFIPYSALPFENNTEKQHPLLRKTMYNNILSGTLHRFQKIVELLIMKKWWNPKVHGRRIIVIIDEMSMVSSDMLNMLLSTLLTCIYKGKVTIEKILFCGDDRQLPPIQYGNVYNAMLQSVMCSEFVRKYNSIQRQSSQSLQLKNFIRAVQERIESGEGIIQLDIPQISEQETFEQVSVDYLHTSNIGFKKSTSATNKESVFIDTILKQKTDWFSLSDENTVAARIITYRNEDVWEWNKLLQRRYCEYRYTNKDKWNLETSLDLGVHEFDRSNGKEFKFKLFDLIIRKANVRFRMTREGHLLHLDSTSSENHDASTTNKKRSVLTMRDFVITKKSRSNEYDEDVYYQKNDDFYTEKEKKEDEDDDEQSDENTEISYLLSNGDQAFILAIDVELELAEIEYVLDGKREILPFSELNKHFKLAYATTIHSSQGSTYPKAIVINRFDQQHASLFWVEVSRASESLAIVYPGLNRDRIILDTIMPITSFLMHENNKYCAGKCNHCQCCVICDYVVKPINKLGRPLIYRKDKLLCYHCDKSEVELDFYRDILMYINYSNKK